MMPARSWRTRPHVVDDTELGTPCQDLKVAEDAVQVSLNTSQ
jgi:hypothetical protein